MKVTVAAIQSAFSDDPQHNIARTEELAHEAAAQGAQIVLPPELFEGHYFCKTQREEMFDRAGPVEGNETIARFQALAEELDIVVPVSFFERSGPLYFNSVAIIDAGGRLLGVYRKSHIPDGPGYQEKYYFRPGDTGLRAWHTRHGIIGVGICWDQWFPEAARLMALDGADILMYPTAIGSEPHDPALHTKDPWQRAMIGHAVSNVVGVVAANRTGTEDGQTFYGHSFIANHLGDVVAEMGDRDQGVICATFDTEELRRQRASWGFFRDRRPDLYKPLSD